MPTWPEPAEGTVVRVDHQVFERGTCLGQDWWLEVHSETHYNWAEITSRAGRVEVAEWHELTPATDRGPT